VLVKSLGSGSLARDFGDMVLTSNPAVAKMVQKSGSRNAFCS
jgi:hypothetical protein